METEIGAI